MPINVFPLTWDIFCRVVDNHGDLGVCWRLTAQLAARGHRVRLWADDARALSWMAPAALEGRWPGVQVLHWSQPFLPNGLVDLPVADVWIEAFGCEIPYEFIAHFTGAAPEHSPAPTWINLEYLSAEGYVERMHRLPSPVLQGPGVGQTKWFFFPGFTPSTGGLLREPDLPARQSAFNRTGWLADKGIEWQGERLVSLFCYEPAALGAWLTQLARSPEPTRLLVTPGRARAAVESVMGSSIDAQTPPSKLGSLSLSYLPHLPQSAYDELLWACDLNFVRGEDSLVRALWAAKPFIWQIYPQDDNAHHAKLEALLDWLSAPESLRQFHSVWNEVHDAQLPDPNLIAWQECTLLARQRLLAQDDLATQLLNFVAEKR
ncbi:elongation factor P maturation arginine rhamnosyltransferase EarP [Ottowia thiooxydans]|uniref:elongation factor P maturation arginine rhamnosyltransferase EarP n=1 Tax=Ottowia thiooxydans TaxID=219182 RepID=UPI0004097A6B|nr:elongation factor P maturation arginine rhamnosyltransferase EarP [Ottowia thiooxydans]